MREICRISKCAYTLITTSEKSSKSLIILSCTLTFTIMMNNIDDDIVDEDANIDIDEGDEENDNLKSKWMNSEPPTRLSGKLLSFSMISLLQNGNPTVDYKLISTNYEASDGALVELHNEMTERHLPESFLNLVTKKSLNTHIVKLRMKILIPLADKGNTKAKAEEKARKTRERESRTFKSEKIQRLKNITVLENAKANVSRVDELYEFLAAKSLINDQNCEDVKVLFEVYKVEGNDLKNSSSTSKECALQAILYENGIKKLMTLISDFSLDWVTEYFSKFTVENVESHVNEGINFDKKTDTRKGIKRKLNDGSPKDFAGGK
jgi:hypothetical protein